MVVSMISDIRKRKVNLSRLPLSIRDYIDVYAALSDVTRMRILLALYSSKDHMLSFNELKEALGLRSGGLNYHLKLLLDAGLIENVLERRGRKISHYRLTDKGVKVLKIPEILHEST